MKRFCFLSLKKIEIFIVHVIVVYSNEACNNIYLVKQFEKKTNK